MVKQVLLRVVLLWILHHGLRTFPNVLDKIYIYFNSFKLVNFGTLNSERTQQKFFCLRNYVGICLKMQKLI